MVADGYRPVRHLDSTPIRIDDVVNAQSAFTQDGLAFRRFPPMPVQCQTTPRIGSVRGLAPVRVRPHQQPPRSDRQRSAPSPTHATRFRRTPRVYESCASLMTRSRVPAIADPESPRPGRCGDRVDSVGFDVADRRVSHLVNRESWAHPPAGTVIADTGELGITHARGARGASRCTRPARARAASRIGAPRPRTASAALVGQLDLLGGRAAAGQAARAQTRLASEWIATMAARHHHGTYAPATRRKVSDDWLRRSQPLGTALLN